MDLLAGCGYPVMADCEKFGKVMSNLTKEAFKHLKLDI
jgi:hypothetical protein